MVILTLFGHIPPFKRFFPLGWGPNLFGPREFPEGPLCGMGNAGALYKAKPNQGATFGGENPFGKGEPHTLW